MTSGNSSILESREDLDHYIDGQHYEPCIWALKINPHGKKCFNDCPFPACICDLTESKQFNIVNYISKFNQPRLI